MSNNTEYAKQFLAQLAGQDVAALNQNLLNAFARILANLIDANNGQVPTTGSFVVLASVFSFIATPPALRPEGSSPTSNNNLAAIEDARDALAGLGIEPVEPEVPIEGETFVLTAANPQEVINGTTKGDLFNATELGSLQSGDIILDPSADDWDVLNATLNSNNINPRITNVEEINLLGEFTTIGMSLQNVSNTKELNLATKIANGTATVTGVNSLNAAEINAGQNINTLNVTSLASGTRDTVIVDAGNAKNVTINGNDGGADKYDVSVAKNTNITLNTLDSSNDAVRIDFAGGATNKITTNLAFDDNLELTLNAEAEATTVELANDTQLADKVILSGTQDITLKSADNGNALSTGNMEISSTTTGTSTIELAGIFSDNSNFQFAAVDVLEISAAPGAVRAITLNNNTKLNLTEAVGNNLTVNVQSGDKDNQFGNDGEGTLRVDVSKSQGNDLITEDDQVGTLILQATGNDLQLDQDSNGFNESLISLSKVEAGDQNVAVIAVGEQAMQIELVEFTSTSTDVVFAASSMTGTLILGNAVTANAEGTIVGSQGFTNIRDLDASKWDINLMSGGSNVNLGSATDGTKLTAAGGNNTITSSDNEVEIVLGAGADRVTVDVKDTVTLGGGADTVFLGNGVGNATTNKILIKDFVKGTDTLQLTGTATDSINLTNLDAPTGGIYQMGVANDWIIQLQNNGTNLTARDMRDSVQLNITAANGSTVVGGDKNDTVKLLTTEDVTFTGGAGSDTLIMATGNDGLATFKDFVVGTDKIVVTGALADDQGVNLSNVTYDSGTGEYTIGLAGNSDAVFKLENNGQNLNTDGNLRDIVQLGLTTVAGGNLTELFAVENAANNTTNVIVNGGSFNDAVLLTGLDSNDQAIFNYREDGSVDTVAIAHVGNDSSAVNFSAITGIGGTGAVVAEITTSKITNTTGGSVYVVADSSNGAGGSKITTFLTDVSNGWTQDVINAEIATFIDANLATATGQRYVVVINDVLSTATYAALDYAKVSGIQFDAYAYLVEGNSNGVTVDDIKLIGQLNDGVDVNGAAGGITIADIVPFA